MKVIVANIPNIITLSNMLCGITAIILAFDNQLSNAGIAIFIGAFLDFIDGFVARTLKAESIVGKQLDSFSDLITFGLAPSMIIYLLICENTINLDNYFFQLNMLAYIAFIIPIFSAIRLSKFNTTNPNYNYFFGIPTPASGIFIASLPIIFDQNNLMFLKETENLILTCLTLSALMVSNIKIFSIKIDPKTKKLNIFRITFLIISIILLYTLSITAIPIIIILHIFLSIINNLIK
ncbi:MAG: CDP-diacylglycerol--serine O-phosphatidyltransferase [Flavobacteriales bacterium]|nr:CDP-diacylglycerol--serine O-phosphatidyltransferase [Flavobacteriales bacterium]|tara:strand:- start:132 stop:839 length:708 start_codon:yes stop_codon:yes gene_type:complete